MKQPASQQDSGHLGYLLTAYLFDSLSAAGRQEVESHLASCSQCRDELAQLRLTLAAAQKALDSGGKQCVFEERRKMRVMEAAYQARTHTLIGRILRWRRVILWTGTGLAAGFLLLVVVACMMGGMATRMERLSKGGPEETRHTRTFLDSSRDSGFLGLGRLFGSASPAAPSAPAPKSVVTTEFRAGHATDQLAETATATAKRFAEAEEIYHRTDYDERGVVEYPSRLKGKLESKTAEAKTAAPTVGRPLVTMPEPLPPARPAPGSAPAARVESAPVGSTALAVNAPKLVPLETTLPKPAFQGTPVRPTAPRTPPAVTVNGGALTLKRADTYAAGTAVAVAAGGLAETDKAGGLAPAQHAVRQRLHEGKPSGEPGARAAKAAEPLKEMEQAVAEAPAKLPPPPGAAEATGQPSSGEDRKKTREATGYGNEPASEGEVAKLKADVETLRKRLGEERDGQPAGVTTKNGKLSVGGLAQVWHYSVDSGDKSAMTIVPPSKQNELAWTESTQRTFVQGAAEDVSKDANAALAVQNRQLAEGEKQVAFTWSNVGKKPAEKTREQEPLREEQVAERSALSVTDAAGVNINAGDNLAEALDDLRGIAEQAGTKDAGKAATALRRENRELREDLALQTGRLERLLRRGVPVAQVLGEDAAGGQPSVECRVLATKPESGLIALSAGSKQNVKAGYQLTISRGDQYVAKVQVDRVEDDQCFAKVLPGMLKQEIRAGDDALSHGADIGARTHGETDKGVTLLDAGRLEQPLRAYGHFRAENDKLTLRDYLRRPAPIPPPVCTDLGLDEDLYIERYGTRPFVDCARDNLSTFGMDVDTASYTQARFKLREGKLPEPDTVRVEEFLNYFKQPYVVSGDDAFGVFAEAAPSPFRVLQSARLQDREARATDLLKIGIKSRDPRPDERKPAMLTFVIDTSGSMVREERLGMVRQALKALVNGLSPEDAVAIVGFSSQAELALPRTQARQKQRILDAIASLEPHGATNVEAGLNLAYRIADECYSPEAVNRIILCSDGVANVGPKGPDEILKLVKVFAGRGIDLCTVGFGMGQYNDQMMAKLADSGNGSCHFVDSLEEAGRIFREQLPPHLNVLARDAKVQVEFNQDVVERYRLLGYEKRKIADKDFRNDKIDAGEVAHSTLVTVMYEVLRKPGSHGSLGKVYLRWKDAGYRHLPVVERNYPLSEGILAGAASPDLRFLACVARFAELLRGSPWVRDGSYAAVLQQLRQLPPEFQERAEWKEVCELVSKAQELSVQHWLKEMR